MKQRSFILVAIILLLSGSTPPLRSQTTDTVRLTPTTKKTFSHKVGALWNFITNDGYWGNTYSEPNWEWPGGSGNVYGWRTSIWIGAIIDSLGRVSAGDDRQFVPLDSITVTRPAQGSRSVEDTYTRYTDVNPPSPGVSHKNLGVEITERTYVWDQSYNDDFIISDYWIKNIGDDRNKDGIIDTTRPLRKVYVAWRLDADVSGFAGSGTVSTLWDADDLVGYDSTHRMVYIYDGDNPNVAGDDIGNPDPVSGVLRSPGYMGIRLLYSDSAHFDGVYNGQPTMATPSSRYNEPSDPGQEYTFISTNGISPNATTVADYRALMAIGPYDIPAGDSIHIVIAWVIGIGFDGMVRNSTFAQMLFDNDYGQLATAPTMPTFTLSDAVVGGQKAVAIRWGKDSEFSRDPITDLEDFDGYAVYRSGKNDASGLPIWDTLAVYTKRPLDPVTDSLWYGKPFVQSWPPPIVVIGGDTVYQYLDNGVYDGLIYAYAVTAFDAGDTVNRIERLENQIGIGRPTTRIFMTNSLPAQSLSNIRVVPNPFKGASRYNNPNPIETSPWVGRIRIINLPTDAKVSIFTLAGDLVKTIRAGETVFRSRDVSLTGDFSGVAEWDLVTKNDQEAVTGLYIYVVESSVGTFTGKFTIIR